MRLCPIWLILLLSDIGEVVPFSVMSAPPTTPNTAFSPLQESTSPLQPIGISDQLRYGARVPPRSAHGALTGLLLPPLPGLPAAPPARPLDLPNALMPCLIIGSRNPTVHRRVVRSDSGLPVRVSGQRSSELNRCFGLDGLDRLEHLLARHAASARPIVDPQAQDRDEAEIPPLANVERRIESQAEDGRDAARVLPLPGNDAEAG